MGKKSFFDFFYKIYEIMKRHFFGKKSVSIEKNDQVQQEELTLRFSQFMNREQTDDHKSGIVAKGIFDFISQKEIKEDPSENLKEKLEGLKVRVRPESQKEMGEELTLIGRESSSLPSISSRLEKNRIYALEQQSKEKSRGFIIDIGRESPEIVRLYNHGELHEVSIEGRVKKISGREVGVVFSRGRRSSMEDAEMAESGSFSIGDDREHFFDLFAVFDGHGGAGASLFAKNNVISALKEALKIKNEEILTDEGFFIGLKECFQQLGKNYLGDDGTTATAAILLNDKIWVANVGDSRTILVDKEGKIIQATEDAKPDIERYKKTIEKLGGYVGHLTGKARVNDRLAPARSIGDKGIVGVSSSPKITVFPFDDFKEGYLVLACDGLYEVGTTDEVGAAIHQMAQQGKGPEEMGKRLVYQAIKNGSTDNVTVLIVKL